MDAKSVLVVDRDEATRRSVRRLLESAELDVHAYASAEAVLEAGDYSAADCLIANTRLPGMGGVELHRELARRGFALPTILLAEPESVSEAVRSAHSMRRNLADLIEKPADDAVLLESVVDALGGREKSAVEPPPDRAAAEALSRLTPRERQVLKQLVNGATNRRIAEQLGISYRTVEVYRTRILLKTQARSFSGLIRMAVMGGLDKVNPEQQ